nr:MAG TPA: hypothetical protein [Caudoviricetes sp.]
MFKPSAFILLRIALLFIISSISKFLYATNLP